MTVASKRALVTFLDGFTVGEDVLELAWDLETHGLSLNVLDGGRLQVLPVERITRADASAIRTHKTALIALCRYIDMKQNTAGITFGRVNNG